MAIKNNITDANILILFNLLRLGLNLCHDKDFESLLKSSDLDWQKILDISIQQGVGSIVYDGLRGISGKVEIKTILPKAVLLSWGVYTMKVEQDYNHQLKIANSLADFYDVNGIQLVILKGFVVAKCYPIPNHRACGDLDCYLMGDYEKGNRLVEEKGIKVTRDFYKHSEFDVNGLHVENHQFCTAVRGSDQAKKFERLLQCLLKENKMSTLSGTNLHCPPPLFNALFLTKHAQGHFISEGITLRHYADWALFMDFYRNQIDWKHFLEICKENKMYNFVMTLTALCERIFKIESPFNLLDVSIERQNLLLKDTLQLYEKDRVHEGSYWKQRFLLIKTMFDDKWKYNYFAEESYFKVLFRLMKGFFFDRNPKL